MVADFHDVLAAMIAQRARFLVVGAHALAAHGVPRATVDLDLWVDPVKVVNGTITAPERPGHGLAFKPEILRDCKVQ